MTNVSYAVFWLLLTVVLAVIELSTMGLITIWFAIGAAVTIIVSLLGGNIWVQLFTFVIVSTVILLTVRPIAAAHFNNHIKKTNIDALVGRKLIVKVEIDNIKGTGKVDMDGSTWLAASSIDEVVIEAGAEVRVVRVQGAKLIVEREV
ncbi:MAG: NfeD family protein [Butyrivibrio sp.]|uniref:NfeD family protein n=1 Tax=Butyrivibrio sp. TaxID=28121 RepID=UPI0025BB81D1|nr:NfeD family protein [Butyrivibrio sp.]MBQ6589187.1 NfeD family protein [Butyrivibrio sp.]